MLEISLEDMEKKFESLSEDLKWAIMGTNVVENRIEHQMKRLSQTPDVLPCPISRIDCIVILDGKSVIR